MRTIFLIFLLLTVPALAGTTLYRWVDEQGRVHYSDTPRPDATEVEVADPMTYDSTAGREPARQRPPEREEPQRPPEFAGYNSVSILAPTPDQVLWNIGSELTVSLGIQPGLQSGHSFRVRFNGDVVRDWPAASLSHRIKGVYRGTHTVSVSVVDAGGREIASGEPVTFYVKQTSILN